MTGIGIAIGIAIEYFPTRLFTDYDPDTDPEPDRCRGHAGS